MPRRDIRSPRGVARHRQAAPGPAERSECGWADSKTPGRWRGPASAIPDLLPRPTAARTGAAQTDSATAVTMTALAQIQQNITRKWRPLNVAHWRASWMNAATVMTLSKKRESDPTSHLEAGVVAELRSVEVLHDRDLERGLEQQPRSGDPLKVRAEK